MKKQTKKPIEMLAISTVFVVSITICIPKTEQHFKETGCKQKDYSDLSDGFHYCSQ